MVAGSDNVVAEKTTNINILGNKNFVAPGNTNVSIQGNNNKVSGSNVTLIGVDGQTIEGDDVLIIKSGDTFTEIGSRGIAKDNYILTVDETIFQTSETILNKFAIFEDGILTIKTGTKTGRQRNNYVFSNSERD